MDNFIEAEFRYAILTGKKSHDFYCQMVRSVSDNGIISLLDQLVRDEVDHLKTFALRYPCDEFDLPALVNRQSVRDHPADLVAAIRDGPLCERNALEILLCSVRQNQQQMYTHH